LKRAIFFSLALVLALVASVGGLSPEKARASLDSLNVPPSVGNGGTVQVTLTLTPSGEATTIEVDNASGNAEGILDLISCQPGCAGDIGDPPSTTITVDDPLVTQIILDLTVACTLGSVQVTAERGEADELQETVTCGGAGAGNTDHPIRLIATPNALTCGGTVEIDVELVDDEGDPVPGEFNFYFATNRGLLVEIDGDTAELTLEPGHGSATVTAGIPGVGENSVLIQNYCGSEGIIASIVLTANPNVIECGGTSILTASARDAAGHVIPGVGFHFATSVGLLVVHPNNANNEEGIASLTLQPGQGDSTVIVSVGSHLGTIERAEAIITVQQFCPGVQVGQNASMAPGTIQLNRSNDNLVCGEQVFIGIKVRDMKGQIPPDGTSVNLLATSGLLEPTTATLKDGVANVTYTAAAINGDVRITAAAGDSYGFTILKVRCATTTGTGSAGPAPCTPIGDGVCIAPPNTGGGNRITPPNTGEAGLK